MADPIDIEEARRLCDGATPAPWRYGALEFGGRCLMDAGGYVFAQIDDDGNGRFAAGARSMLPAAIDEIERLRVELAQARSDLAHLQSDAGPDSCADFVVRLRAELAEAHEALTAEIAAHQRTSASLGETAQELRERLDGCCERCQERCSHG